MIFLGVVIGLFAFVAGLVVGALGIVAWSFIGMPPFH